MGKTDREILKSLKQLGGQVNLDPVKDEKIAGWLLNCYKDIFPKTNTFNFNFYLHTVRPVAISLLLFVFVFASGIGLAYGSKNTLPGSLMYSVKLKIEKTRIALATTKTKKAVLRAQTLSNRLGEAKLLAAKATQGEQTFAPEFLFLADNFQKELEVLKNEITSQILKDKPVIKENLASSEYFYVPMQPDLPVQDGKEVLALDIEKLLIETQELLTAEDLVMALVKIEQAANLVSPTLSNQGPALPQEDLKEQAGSQVNFDNQTKEENEIKDIEQIQKEESIEMPVEIESKVINYYSAPKTSKEYSKPVIINQTGSMGRVLEQIGSNDFKVDMQKDAMVRTKIKRDLNNK